MITTRRGSAIVTLPLSVVGGNVGPAFHSSATGANPRRASDAAGLPSIAVAANQGRFGNLLARFGRVRTVLEPGTLGGYSTIWSGRRCRPCPVSPGRST
jgi:hypothetical protein